MTAETIFHCGIFMSNMDKTYNFYVNALGFTVTQKSETAMVIKFGHHQLVPQIDKENKIAHNALENLLPHFGLIFVEEEDWNSLLHRARIANLKLFKEPFTRYPDLQLEHKTFSLRDPSGNLLEFLWYRNKRSIFGIE